VIEHYPTVVGEYETIAAVAQGNNLARFGDGEVKIAHGFGYSREPPNRDLTAEIRRIIAEPNDRCLVGIPTMDKRGPKYANWTRHIARFNSVLSPSLTYYSAFVTRPDSAPWIDSPDYGRLVQSLWQDKRAAVVCERKGSIFDSVRRGAGKTKHIECPHSQAYAAIDALEAAVIKADPEIAILSAGPTATCLANRLAKHGIHAVDLGSMGRFIGRLLDQC
jgi:glycosyltransferase GT-like protein